MSTPQMTTVIIEYCTCALSSLLDLMLLKNTNQTNVASRITPKIYFLCNIGHMDKHSLNTK